MKYAILGFGGRGSLYTELFAKNGANLAAVCETRTDRLEKAVNLYGLPTEKTFLASGDFFAAGKLADLCIIATQDSQHVEHASAALELGYDLLLEKPIAVKLDDCRAIYEKAKRLKRKVFICHVLRYSPFFRIIKDELDSGEYGKIATINLTENVAWWHQAHSFVRGDWRTTKEAAPMIVAKCCHDLDIVSWLADSECKAVSSMGSLGFFKPKNAPNGSSDRCLTCAVKADCIYNAERFYITERVEKGITKWPVSALCEKPTRERVLDALKKGPYGRCAFKCDNDVVDRQVVNMEFAEGLTAHLTMTAFADECYREIHVHCESGEIFGNMLDNILTCNIFGKKSKKIDVKVFEEGEYGHGGGDYLLVKDIIAVYSGQIGQALTSIENSMQSHSIGFAAEKSRLNGGSTIFLDSRACCGCCSLGS